MHHHPQINAKNPVEALKFHLNTDPLAANALNKGNKGVDGEREDRPPMNKAKFLETADEWLEGHEEVPCAGWEGTITQTESVNLTTSHDRSDASLSEHTTQAQNATRTTEITVGGDANVRIAIQGTERIDTTIVSRGGGRSCTSTVQTARVYGTTDGVTSAEARSAKVTFFPADGGYRLTIVGPAEQTTKVERSSMTHCTLGAMPGDSETLTLDHPAWTVEIEGQLADPSDRSQLKGSKTETVTQEHQAWLTANGGNVATLQIRDNGELLPVPVEVTTTWDLRRRTDD